MWKDYSDYLIKTLDLNQDAIDYKFGKENIILKSAKYSGKYILKSRETSIIGGETDIYNNIVYPNTGSNLPCLGMDLMCFFEKKVIIVFDFQHPIPNYDWDNPFMRCHLEEMLDNTSKDIRFFQAGNHFSRYIYVRKCTKDEIPEHLENFKRYVDVYKELLESNKPTENNIEEYAEFDRYMLDLDPVSGYMESKFDQYFAKNYVNDFLFPYSTLQ